MINHDLRCIFIHIPRTGGSNVEQWLAGKDWWFVEPATKHLSARQARQAYRPYWSDYFKFSVVRHPLDRAISTFHYAQLFGLALRPDGSIDFTGYRRLFGHPVTVEHDYRFAKMAGVVREDHQPGQIYGNWLDCEIDFVARFETLQADMAIVGRQLGIAQGMDTTLRRLNPYKGVKPDAANPATIATVEALYARDYDRYGYNRAG